MKYSELSVRDAWVIEVEPQCDERGLFARTFCSEEFGAHGLPTHYCQSSVSFNPIRGTLRGMHFQIAPSQECKLIRCTHGAMFDVILDLREDSKTFGSSIGIELSVENRRSVAVPSGCAHGFITLKDNTEVLYKMSDVHDPTLARGVRWNDPAFSISWPIQPVLMSERDAHFPDFRRDLLRGEKQ